MTLTFGGVFKSLHDHDHSWTLHNSYISIYISFVMLNMSQDHMAIRTIYFPFLYVGEFFSVQINILSGYIYLGVIYVDWIIRTVPSIDLTF